MLLSCSSKTKEEVDISIYDGNIAILSNQRTQPNGQSNEYISIIEIPLNVLKIFNTQEIDTKRIILKGIEITLDATSNDFNNIYEKLVGNISDPRNDLEKLDIYCDKLNIIGRVRFPQTDISIFANSLNFIDKDSIKAIVSTKPLTYSSRGVDASKSSNAKNGLDGMTSGNIDIKIKELLINSKKEKKPFHIRFDLSGGDGQNPGEGREGEHGKDIPSIQFSKNYYGHNLFDVCDCLNKNYGRYRPKTVANIPCKSIIFIGNIKIGGWALQGSNEWPGNGYKAKPSGIPGRGGKGGILTISKNLINPNDYTLDGGKNGIKGKDQLGGRGGLPNPAYKICHNGCKVVGVCTNGVHKSKKGLDALAPEPKFDSGLPGKVNLLDKTEWLTVELVDLTLDFTNDLYKSGYDSISRKNYLNLYNDIKHHEEINSNYTTNWVFKKTSALNTILKSINQIDNEIDFYGFPKSWVPTLSLELMMQSYDNQINTSFKELFLYHQILNRAKNNLSFKNNLNSQSKKEIININRINNALSENIIESKRLDQLVIPIRDSIDVYQKLIKNETERLMKIAEEIVEDRDKNEGIISDLKKLGEYAKLASLVYSGGQSLGGIELISSLEEIQNNLTGLNDDSKWKESTKTIKKLNELSKNVTDISEILNNLKHKKPKNRSEILTEFEVLKNRSKYYKELVERAIKIVDNSKDINARMGNVFIELQSLMEELSSSIHNKSILENKTIHSLRYTDNNLIDIIQKQKKQNENKLIKFQYYLLRSFEYEFLKTYPTNFTLNRTYGEFERILSSNPHSEDFIDLKSEQMASLKSIYKQDINKVVELGLVDLNNRGERQTSFIEYKFSKAEIKNLENGNKVILNPSKKNLLFENERVQRIVNVKISNLKINKTSEVGIIRIKLKHSGNSILLKNDKVYNFQHGNSKNQPFQWVFSFSVANKEELKSSSITDKSLIKALLYVDGKEGNTKDIRKHSLPGLISNLEIEVLPPPKTKLDLETISIQN